MKRDEILSYCASNPEIIVAYIESLESQVKELTERLVALESRLNQIAGGHPTLKDGVCFGPPARLFW
ncbi:Mobile element protein [Methanosarcina mazei C16]|uniref:Mobile element protein n=1 Tax=Methanosarcina mazei C16 TaxID=1434113 RepID=A0A0E3RYR9_METMZ|nr:hypothetical protein [Methanosarcina mazei]AKB72686.1 Mobile element protein [Methanosarcina mazei C16]